MLGDARGCSGMLRDAQRQLEDNGGSLRRLKDAGGCSEELAGE